MKNSLFSVLHVLSLLLLVFGVALLFPLAISHHMGDGAELAYDEALLATWGAGIALWLATRRRARELRIRDGFLLVVLVWTVLPLFATIPLLVYFPALSFTDAYFETMSGLTATGATVLSGLDALPVSINFWRTFLHWIGGMGIIVLAVAILPLLGVGGRQIFKTEVPGPMKEANLSPRMAETARGFWVIYTLFTVICGFALYWAGMGGWDAVMHAFSIMGLGGLSSKDASLGHFASVPIELIAMGFALLSGISYVTHYMAFHGRSLRAYLHDAELPFYLGVLAASILGLTAYLMAFDIYADFWEALRYVAFHSISLATSLGFSTTDYAQWPMFAQLWVLFLGSFIACSGSTGGGIKMVRAIILYKQVFLEVLRSLHPSVVRLVKLGGAPVPVPIIHAVLAFGFVYMVSIVSLTLVMTASGLDVVTGFSAVVACINNTGPGLGLVGPAGNYAVLSDLQTWVCTFAMLLGRLEIFTLLVVLSPAFWRK